MIRAAGGIVVRGDTILLVHRARYDDWSLPKGHVEDGESWEDAALREVWEETGLRCELGEYVGASHYEVRGEPKEVRYWRMSSNDEAGPSSEVDAVRWASVDDARNALSYARERELLDLLLL
ncbi:MAG TPA: NUDIX hydrolase [Gaiellaceae bacterium]|nr:NUDIX hydrolase [Gaiellaceae bacterium]